MLKNFFQQPVSIIRRALTRKAPVSQERRPDPLMKARPLTLSESYNRSLDKPELDAIFLRLRRNIVRTLENLQSSSGKALVTRETGVLASGEPYFFVKSFGRKGWLFERSQTGWVICRAEKIHTADTFIRGEFAWDVASCLTNQSYEATPRVNSSRFELKLVSLSIYEQKVIDAIVTEFSEG